MNCHSKYENGDQVCCGPDRESGIRKGLSSLWNHSSFSNRSFVDRHIDNGMLKWAILFSEGKKKISNPSSPLAVTIQGKKRSLSFNWSQRKRQERSCPSHREIQLQRDLACDLLPIRAVWLLLIGPWSFFQVANLSSRRQWAIVIIYSDPWNPVDKKVRKATSRHVLHQMCLKLQFRQSSK